MLLLMISFVIVYNTQFTIKMKSEGCDTMLTPVRLPGRLICLEPMTIDHVNDLCNAASEDRSTYTYTNVPFGLEETKRYIEGALMSFAKGRALPFVVRHIETDRIIGTTRFLDLEVFPGRLHGHQASPMDPRLLMRPRRQWLK